MVAITFIKNPQLVMKKRITSTVKRGFSVHLFLMTLMLTLSFAGMAQNRGLSTKSQNGKIATLKLQQAVKSNRKQIIANDNVTSPLDAVKGKREDVSKRDYTSKHYINDDGSYTALMAAGPIHYKNGENFLAIDHSIQNNLDGNYPYANKTNLFESFFGANAHDGIKNKTAEGEMKEFLNTKMYWEVNGQAVNTANSANSSITVQANKAYYNNMYGSISAEFIMESGRRKLNYIIPNQASLGNVPANADYLVFTEDIFIPNGWKVENTNFGIKLSNPISKGYIFYNNPTSTDNTNSLEQENTIFEVIENNNMVTIKTKVKLSWLLNSNRQFPVKVDPTTNYYPNGTTYQTGQCFTTGGGYGTIAVGFAGGFYRGFATFDTSSLDDNATITTTTLYHNVGTTQGMNAGSRGTELRSYLGLPQDQGTFSNIYTAITNGTISPGLYATVTYLNTTGWKNTTLGTTANTHLKNRLGVNNFTIGYRPSGTYTQGSTQQYAQIYGTPDPSALNREPYIAVTYTIPNATLTVTEAYTGATYGNGVTSFTPGTSVTATSGSRSGFSVSGWTGTGSVPATGTTGSATFTITQNSTITWNWVSQTTTGASIFYNTGGTDQLAFNNSRLNDDTPTFRISHGINAATNYQINIQDNPTFTGAGETYTQNFTGSFAQNTEANFTISSTAGLLTAGKTYYVRARTSGDSASTYSAWSTLLHSFTYAPAAANPHWFQTTQAQLTTATTSGVTANATNSLELTASGGNVITNGSFESSLTGWTITRAGTWYTVASEPYGNSDGANALNIYNNNPGTFGYFTGDASGAYQNVNLTGVNMITYTAGFEGQGSLIVQCRVYISDVGQTGATAGTLINTWSPPSNLSMDNTFNIDISSYGFTGNKLLKFIYYVTGQETTYNERYLYIDNVQATSLPSGTATSTPFNLASVQGAAKYETLEWNQTLNGGAVSMKLQSSSNGTTWTDVAGYTNITYTGDGLKTHDITGVTASAYLRAIATLSGVVGVAINDWALYAKQPCESTIASVTPASSSICSNTTTTITAVATNPADTIRWYAAASGGSILATGATFTTPNLTTTTSYYVVAYNGTCESDVRTQVTITVNQIPSSVAVALGTPANGTTHYIAVSYTAVAGATQYQIDYSWDNSSWTLGGFSTTTTYNLNLNDNPNRQVYIRVKRYDNGGLPDCFAFASPIYTAADVPNLVVLANPTGTTMQITLQAETPVANPAITTYSLFNEALGLYVQADGSLGATEVFQTKATWGTKTVTGLTAETEYCFYAKAKNEDGDVRFVGAQTLFPTQEFNSNVLTTGSTASNTAWFAPNSNTPFAYNSTGGCNGGRVGYNSSWNNFWGNFLRLPEQNLTGSNEVTIGLTVSHSYLATTLNNYFRIYIGADGGYLSGSPTSIKINGIPYTSIGTPVGKVLFDEARDCVYVEMTFNISSVSNKSNILFYIDVKSSYNNGSAFYFYMDDIAMTGGASFSSPDKVCLTTTAGCTAEITNVTGNTGCGSVTLLAAGATGTTAYNWYDAATGGTLLQSSASDSYTTPVLTETTTYYVSASNATCESPRVAVIATYAPTSAAIISTTGASSCIPGTLTIYAETNNDANYTVNWYANETGGTAIHIGYSYTPNPIILETTSFWAAAVDGDCESERTEVAITLSSKTWNGSVDTNWNVAGNWSPAGIPNINNCVVIANTTNAPILLTGNAGYAKSLSLLEGSSLVVQSTSSLTVTEKVTIAEDVNGATVATMTLMNNGYLLQTQNAQANINQGKIKVHRNSTPMFRLDASAWSSPVENQKLYDFALGTVFGRVYSYDEGTNAFVNTGITTNSTFVNGLGYSVRSPNTYPTYNASNPPAPVVFEGEFYGKPNNGNIGISITANNLGNNYVGNPYPSPIDAMGLLDNNNSIDALYFWTHEAHAIGGTYAANNYASFNLSGGTVSAAGGEEPDGIIQVGQGFVVKATQNISLEFTNDIRINYSDGQFFRTNNNVVERHRMWLNLSSSTTEFNQALIGYIPNATMEKDHQIDAKMLDYAGSAIYSLIDTESYVIQGRSLPFDIADEVPLGIKAQQAGIFTIAIDHVDGLFQEGQTIYIVDQMTNLVHNLSAGAFTFVSEQGTFNSRFKIVYQDNLLGVSNPEITNNDWIVYKNDDKIHVQTNGFEIDNISIYDLTGRLLLQDDNVNSATFSCNANFAEQVLLVRVNKTLVKKVL